jgi:hypothetical protein
MAKAAGHPMPSPTPKPAFWDDESLLEWGEAFEELAAGLL